MKKGAGELFQEETRYTSSSSGDATRPASPSSMSKEYKGAKTFQLEPPERHGGGGLWETVEKRRSVRRYADRPISARELSQLLWVSCGLTRKAEGRASPSAGARYPLEVYPCVRSVEGFDPGVYHYRFDKHSVELVREGDFSAELAEAAGGQRMVEAAGVNFVVTAIFARTTARYRQRGYRYAYLDAGALGEHIHLASTALGLGSCLIGAFQDDAVEAVIGVDGGEEQAVYMVSVGRMRE